MTSASAIGRPCESTTRPRNGLRGKSRTSCGGISGVLTSRRIAEAKPSACTVSVSSSQLGSMNRPVRNPPLSSVRRRWELPTLLRFCTTIVAAATGRPVGLETVPETDRPVFITPAFARARRPSAVTGCESAM